MSLIVAIVLATIARLPGSLIGSKPELKMTPAPTLIVAPSPLLLIVIVLVAPAPLMPPPAPADVPELESWKLLVAVILSAGVQPPRHGVRPLAVA